MLDESGRNCPQPVELAGRKELQRKVPPALETDVCGDVVDAVFEFPVFFLGYDQKVVIGVGKKIPPGPRAEEVNLANFIPLLPDALEKSGQNGIFHVQWKLYHKGRVWIRRVLYNTVFMLGENLERVRGRIVAAAKRAGRDPGRVRLVCVTKGVPVERIREAIAAGVTEIGENRVQEAKEKQPAIGCDRIRWHLIGHLQRNKAKPAVELFDVIHSVDSPELVETLDRHAALRQAQGERKLEVLVQVNVSAEAAKHGCTPDEAKRLAEAILKSAHLRLAGLMTMAPFSENPESARPVFSRLRELRNAIDPSLDLSMGMSADFETAVEEGATLVRIGTAIFHNTGTSQTGTPQRR